MCVCCKYTYVCVNTKKVLLKFVALDGSPHLSDFDGSPQLADLEN